MDKTQKDYPVGEMAKYTLADFMAWLGFHMGGTNIRYGIAAGMVKKFLDDRNKPDAV